MANRQLTILALLGSAALAGAALQAADTPPRNLKLYNGHWTPWEAPPVPEGARVHIVVPGDTFWDLAATNLGNPYLWPQIWEKNQYVRDAHWIYPGDPIILDLQVTGATEVGAVTTGTEMEDLSGVLAEGDGAAADALAQDGQSGAAGTIPGVGTAGGRGSVPVPLGTQDDIYCSGFIGAEDETFGYSVIGSEYDVLSPQLVSAGYGKVEGIYGAVDSIKVKLTTGDIVYLDGGRTAGLSPGMQFTAIATGRTIRHPVSRDELGRQYNYMGRVRVLSVQDNSAIAEIVQSCDGISVGMKLKPFEPEPIPLARRTSLRPYSEPTSGEALAASPVILSSPVDIVSLGQDHVVFIDRGEDDEVLPGDMFTIYRLNRDSNPPVVLGELAILSVQAHTAVAKILESRYPVYVGDRLERK